MLQQNWEFYVVGSVRNFIRLLLMYVEMGMLTTTPNITAAAAANTTAYPSGRAV